MVDLKDAIRDAEHGFDDSCMTTPGEVAILLEELQRYRNTGLEPEEIVKRLMMFEDSKRYSGRLEAKLKRYQEAESEGRLLILPCKIGDTLYRVCHEYRQRRPFIRTVTLGRNNLWRILFGGEFGKTAFLTREEAEEAMKKEEV